MEIGNEEYTYCICTCICCKNKFTEIGGYNNYFLYYRARQVNTTQSHQCECSYTYYWVLFLNCMDT